MLLLFGALVSLPLTVFVSLCYPTAAVVFVGVVHECCVIFLVRHCDGSQHVTFAQFRSSGPVQNLDILLFRASCCDKTSNLNAPCGENLSSTGWTVIFPAQCGRQTHTQSCANVSAIQQYNIEPFT